jgi:hypothetical protein
MGQLGFLVIPDDPDIVERHDGDHLGPGMDVLPGAHAALADHPSDRRGDARIAEIDLRQVEHRLFGFDVGAQLRFLRVEHPHLAPLRL